MSKNQFRTLVIFSILLTCLGGLYDYFFPDRLTEQVIDYTYNLESDRFGENELFYLSIMGSAIILAIASFIGILLFKNWGRHLYLAGLILLLPLYPYIGITVYSGWGLAFYDLSILLSGVILALMYYSPVAKYFDS